LIDVVLVKSDPIINQPTIRDQRIIKSLNKKYPVMVLGWDRVGLMRGQVSWHGSCFKLLNFRAPSGAPTLLLYLPFFWIWVFVNLTKYRPKVIHACDFEAVLPCQLYRMIFKNKLVFDVFDRYGMAYIPRKNAFFRKLYSFTNSFEERLAERADVLISVSDELINTFQRKPKKCISILNCAEDYAVDRRARSDKDNKLTIAFTGHIRRNRGLEALVAATKNLNGVNVVVTGRTEDKKMLAEIGNTSNGIKYLGYLEHTQVLTVEANSDAMFALYNLDENTQNKYVMGNKLFEAMMCGVPIITNVAAEIVNETQCGILVDYNNLDQIKQAIINLRDNIELRKKLGDNGRKAFLQKYNWGAMEHKLHKIYEELLQEDPRSVKT
jgi:glycosyltransferase involved in cell wall biosynthesis